MDERKQPLHPSNLLGQPGSGKLLEALTTWPEGTTIKAWDTYRAEMWHRPIKSTCPECGGGGFLRLGNVSPGHPDFGKVERCPVCSIPERQRWLLKNCGLQGRELDIRGAQWALGNWDDGGLTEQRRAAHGSIARAISDRAGLFTYYGDFGSGKTMALQMIVNELRLKLIESFYAPMATLLDHLRSLYGQGRESSDFWQRLLDIPVLAVDEITRFNETQWAKERLFVLVDTRYRRRDSHLTLFATNDDPRQVLPASEQVGYLYSRMRQGALVELRGDMRGVGA